tara:strand:+ start:6659 stop:7006 length:348 start_codon:yes stop_codon:yes gene_type:complete
MPEQYSQEEMDELSAYLIFGNQLIRDYDVFMVQHSQKRRFSLTNLSPLREPINGMEARLNLERANFIDAIGTSENAKICIEGLRQYRNTHGVNIVINQLEQYYPALKENPDPPGL